MNLKFIDEEKGETTCTALICTLSDLKYKTHSTPAADTSSICSWKQYNSQVLTELSFI